MEFGILGPLEVSEGGRLLDLGARKQRCLLAVLLLEANRVVSADRLVEVLWDGRSPPSALKSVQIYVSQLRKILGRDRVVTRAPGYLLRVESGELDLDRFEELQAAGRLREALQLWRGPALAEFVFEPFAEVEARRLEELRVLCVERRIERDLAEGRHGELVGELERLVAEHPLRQGLRAQLMVALYRSGRDAEALEVYQDLRRQLTEELGIEPRRELRDLQQAILRQDPALDLAAPAPTRAVPMRAVFVGRERDLEQLSLGLDDALGGRGRLFLLVGEPGIGKSRLAEEALRLARARGVDVLVGRCWEASGAPAYWPWVQSLRAFADDAPPELAALLRGEPVADDTASARFRVFDAAARFLADAAASRPLLLFLDDLHAADEPSLLLLRFVARELASMRVLLVGACRDVDPVPGRALSELLAEVAREPVTTRLDLRGLSETDVAAFVAETAAEFASPELAAELYEETEGNPLFLGETVRLLAVEGRIAIPHSLREVITRRLSHLGEECNRVLALAAVLGREFDHAPLGRMSGLSEDELLERLDEAMQARVVSEVPGAATKSRFAHVLIRDALYDGFTSARRIRLHRLAVEALEELQGDDAELAYHASAGNDPEKARRCARRAGDRALALLAYEEAARLYDVALAATREEQERCELLLARGEAEMRAGNAAVAKETFAAAAAVARALGLGHALARAAAGYGGRMFWARAGDDERVVPLLEEGIAALGDEEVVLRTTLLARLAGALRDEFSRERRDALSQEAVELARASGIPSALCAALAGRAHAIAAPDAIDELLALATELCEAATAAGDLERLETGHVLRIMPESWRGDREAVYADLTAAARIAFELKQPIHLWEIAGLRTNFALAEGKLAEAKVLMEEALAAGENAIPEAALPHYWMHRFGLADLTDDLASVEPQVAALAKKQPARPVFACAHAYVLARLGQLQTPLAPLTESLPFDQEWLLGMNLLAEAAALVDDLTTAAAAYDALLPWESLHAVDQSEGCRGAIARSLGLVARALGHRRQAADHFERALELNNQMGFHAWVERTRKDSGAAPA